MNHVNPVAFQLTDEIHAAMTPRPTLQDIIEWIDRQADAQFREVQFETLRLGRVPDGMARELAVGRKAIDLLGKIIERQDEVLFLLRAKPRAERGRR